jgi:hypothetical protein
MQVVDFDGGRSRTRTCDLSHVSLSPNANFEQIFLENPKQTISRAGESLASFARSCQRYTDKRRHSGSCVEKHGAHNQTAHGQSHFITGGRPDRLISTKPNQKFKVLRDGREVSKTSMPKDSMVWTIPNASNHEPAMPKIACKETIHSEHKKFNIEIIAQRGISTTKKRRAGLKFQRRD